MHQDFYCERCERVIDPVPRAVVEAIDDMYDRRPIEQIADGYTCPHCDDPVVEVDLCFDCRERPPESGADHCLFCLRNLEAEKKVVWVHLSGWEIAQMCEHRSTNTCEVYAEIRSVNGIPVVALQRAARPETQLGRCPDVGSNIRQSRLQAG